VPHDVVLAGTTTALGAGFAEIVTSAEVVARLGSARDGRGDRD
jgi:hypothetical protein